MADRPENRVFGRKEPQHIIILASGDRIRHMTVRPWMLAVAFCFAGMFTVGYLAATSYLVLRDGLIGATMARQARMQHDYEDRISALRAQVDRVTSRQLLDQQVVEEKVEKLFQQQLALTERNGKLDTLLNRAGDAGLSGTVEPDLQPAEPAYGRRAEAAPPGLKAIDRLLGRSTAAAAPRQASAAALAYAAPGESVADRTDRMFSKVTLSLKDIERQQLSRITSLTAGAAETADAIERILARNDIAVPTEGGTEAAGDAIGGPFVEPETGDGFETSLGQLDTALNRLELMRGTVRRLPFANPSPGSQVSSRFGNRTDPFLGRLALHAGIDFRLPVGSAVEATGSGTVVTAGRTGGYGNLVEIDHGSGLSTRYAHLSRVLVKAGDTVDAGETIGLSGSTGRSTGPHLHYEVRRNGRASDPARFLSAGTKLSTYMN
ncbi:M23 family metallopeptidase [Rhizobium sp. TRM96647]|uniref:M23 family metallopeptidase n=1 Tax=unclassified Rhizobium TaxID=2613769 RepID=UPI0021E7E518|nr:MULTISPECIES: M23 family metallopeptidase [unclassified Rhizobium]MCV3737450.1 M23 family metallopeptidase [Rhizobium sp. TRM96647]MCV3756460.1 M23 family metallopeptidase [Rhizobium sp. TRM96650]